MSDLPAVRNALISVSDKTGLAEFARELAALGVALYSTGGTRRFLVDQGLAVHDVGEYTGFPEMMDGRVKTLHPKIHGGILCRRDHAEDMQHVAQHGMVPFDLVVVNLYPFAATVARAGTTDAEAIEQIDIGGPSLVRAAAKNHAFVAIVTAPGQYPEVLAELRAAEGRTSLPLRRRLAAAAFAHTASYDRVMADYFDRTAAPAEFPVTLRVEVIREQTLRYGENPHQPAALYCHTRGGSGHLLAARQRHGKELSYNNLLDLDSALGVVRLLAGPAAAVIKHNNPCGAAEAADLATATRAALEGDRLSAFGSVLAMNRPVDAATAEVLAAPGLFVEAIAAPDFEPAAFEILTTRPKWKANVRLLAVGAVAPLGGGWDLRSIAGGLLVQAADVLPDPEAEWTTPTRRGPTDAERAELRFAWNVVRCVKSNAIVVTRDRTLLGAGAGQMSRVDSVEIALRKAGERGRGGVMASDAFFPFPDSIELAARAGITALIQPGGSKNDPAAVEACDRHGLTMVFTGRRHFRH